ncbi:MAG: multicopper oxidase domain-containing protein, partial [Candidatus Tectomicrobia bacterium]|nr:multicopper oxidase domain-containing protein [Candidatus Tectomicrobia bacterium]
SDVLVQIKKAGVYLLMDGEIKAEEALGGSVDESEKILAAIKVVDSVKNVSRHLRKRRMAGKPLPRNMPRPAALAKYKAFESLQGKQHDDEQYVRFSIVVDRRPPEDTDLPGLSFRVGDNQNTPVEDDKPFDNDAKPRSLTLGNIDKWTIKSEPVVVINEEGQRRPGAPGREDGRPLSGHPFHIHVNPFEIISLKNEKGDEQLHKLYNGPVWKDTLFVPERWTATLLTQYLTFTGEFVLHCHILDHEDAGMMQKVKIVSK